MRRVTRSHKGSKGEEGNTAVWLTEIITFFCRLVPVRALSSPLFTSHTWLLSGIVWVTESELSILILLIIITRKAPYTSDIPLPRYRIRTLCYSSLSSWKLTKDLKRDLGSSKLMKKLLGYVT